MTLSMKISRDKQGNGCAVFEIGGHKFFVPQISMSYTRPQWATLGGTSMFQMFTESTAELIDADTVRLSHSGWDGDLVLKVKDKYRAVESFGSGTFYSTFRGMKVKVFKSVVCGEWDTDDTHETW
jgi:hypothetical protein